MRKGQNHAGVCSIYDTEDSRYYYSGHVTLGMGACGNYLLAVFRFPRHHFLARDIARSTQLVEGTEK